MARCEFIVLDKWPRCAAPTSIRYTRTGANGQRVFLTANWSLSWYSAPTIWVILFNSFITWRPLQRQLLTMEEYALNCQHSINMKCQCYVVTYCSTRTSRKLGQRHHIRVSGKQLSLNSCIRNFCRSQQWWGSVTPKSDAFWVSSHNRGVYNSPWASINKGPEECPCPIQPLQHGWVAMVARDMSLL